MSVARSTRRFRVGVTSAVREFVREPVNLGLLLAVPPIVVLSYGSMMAAFPKMPYMTTDPATMGAINGTMYVAAFLPGVIGLFQVISARRADERLSLAGFPRATLFVSRLLAVVLASVLTAALGLAVLATRTDVAAPLPGLVTLAFVGVLYGLVGMLVGAVLPRELEGSLVLVFLADVDEALASGIMGADAWFTRLFPLHYPHQVFQAAVDGNAIEGSDALWAGVYGLVLLAVALGIYARVTSTGGAWE